MYLHRVQDKDGYPCGAVALSYVNGKLPKENVKDILEFRARNKPWKDEWVNRENYFDDREHFYFNEAKHFFAPYMDFTKIKTPRGNPKLRKFIRKLPPQTFLVWTTEHIQIIKNRKIFDTIGANISIEDHWWANEPVRFYTRLISK
jgi:hypothetical protein